MEIRWNEAQRRAIYTRDTNLLVSAAAGSGKTAVLTERIVQLVREGTDIDRFLVVTFTEAATAEMKRRIARRLLEVAQEAEQEEHGSALAKRLRAQAAAAPRANISTIHAFCLYILRRNFHILGLDPAFSTADNILSELLLREAMEKAAEDAFAKEDAGFRALLRALGGDLEAVYGHTLRLRRFLFAQEAPWAWLEKSVSAYADGIEELWGMLREQALSTCFMQVREHIHGLIQARRAIPGGAYESVQAVIDDDCAKLRALLLHAAPEDYLAALKETGFAKMSWPRDMEAETAERIRKARSDAAKTLREQEKTLSLPYDDENGRMGEMAEAAQAFAGFFRAVDEEYAARKRERAKIDFHDMEQLALQALENDAVRTGLQSRFRYIFVDEYQDSNRIQERLLSCVKRENNVFLVGDVKQSIYRFRQADPGLFLEKLRDYDAGGDGMCIHLNTNFRSGHAVIRAVNDVFGRIMTEEAGEIAYDGDAALKTPPDAPADGVLAGCELHLIDHAMEMEEGDDEQERPEQVEAEAMLAARRIHALMEGGQLVENGACRALRYSDFVVLLRSHRAAGESWARTLAREGIPAYVQLTGGYFDAIEVQVFLNLLRVIDNARQDIPLASALRSPVFRFDEAMLIDLKTGYPADSLYESLLACAAEDTVLGRKARGVLDFMAHWRREARLLPLEEFLAALLDESRLYECMGAMNEGETRQANLDALIERARAYAVSGGACDLWSFLSFMDGAKSTADMGTAQVGAADVVRVLSMHGAKGLEFPVVICASLGKRFNDEDSKKPILFDPELGLGMRLIVNGVRKDTLLRSTMVERMRRKNGAEEMRILYVGMTRAKTRLIMIGTTRRAREAAAEAKHTEITPAYCMRAKSFLDWLLPAAVQSDSIALKLHPVPAPGVAAGETESPAPDLVEHRLQELLTRYAWRYPYADAARTPSKLSVSELISTREVVLREAPAFAAKEKTLTAAQQGTALHDFMRYLRFMPVNDAHAYAQSELARIQAAGYLNSAQARSIDMAGVAWFMGSELFARICTAEKAEHEFDFSVEIPANELMDTASREPVLLQGVIDCCFLEGGAWVLIDYKTDRVAETMTAEEAARAHALQLSYYGRALRALTGRSVKETYVVLLRARQAVRLA